MLVCNGYYSNNKSILHYFPWNFIPMHVLTRKKIIINYCFYHYLNHKVNFERSSDMYT